jgi:hypothetical protein
MSAVLPLPQIQTKGKGGTVRNPKGIELITPMVAPNVRISTGFLFRQEMEVLRKVTCSSVPGASFYEQKLMMLFFYQ